MRLENMSMSASGESPLPALRRQIAASVDLVVQRARLRSGYRCVTNVDGIGNDIVTTEEMWRRRPGPVDAVSLREPLLAAFRAHPRIGEDGS